MTVEVRPCAGTEDFKQAFAPIAHFFGRAPTDETAERHLTMLPPERMHAASLDGAVVGGAGALPFELTVPGRRVPAAGVTMVGVLPTHRRRGILRALMRAQLDDVHERGEPVAVLWASESTIYGRFGYGMASLCGELELRRDRGAFGSAVDSAAAARLVDHEEALELLPGIYDRVAAETPGMFSRSRAWWEGRRLFDPEWRREGGGELQHVVLELDGEPAAYALYRLHVAFEYGSSTGRTSVLEAMGVSPAATREIWRYLLDVDWMERVEAGFLPVDHPLLLLVAEPRRLRFTLSDALWVRLVDVRAALEARILEDGPPVVLDVADAFCPWNEGRWRVGPDRVEPARAEPDLRLDVSALGSVYLGGFTFTQLARAGRVQELRPGALAEADAVFRSDRAPWCPEIF